MKLPGGKIVKLKPRYIEMRLGETEDGTPIIARVHAPKLGLLERLFKELPEIEPPQRGVVKDKRGEVVRDAYNKPLPIRDVDDPVYVSAAAERQRMLALAAFLECTAGQFEWEARREAFPTMLDYLRAVFVEMEAFGVDRGTFQAIDATIAELTRPAADVHEVDAAREALGAPPAPKVPEGK